ncbi:hypothetical protein EKO27_g5616 [Xylaria grammica]|uniref:Uncharacterized protein n=1 Tax=Xylaria grammica TaxID=363999 RepID=A0A439D526_9PEZI|nr:hypothetical protein EKO27_g5616 [Xylaria grammica]
MCVNTQQLCRYPDQHKRGLPAGFLNAMESRLRETEMALFYALSELYEGSIEHRAYAELSDSPFEHASLQGPAQSKSETMEKWASLPLGDRTQAKAWFLNHRIGDSLVVDSSRTAQLDTQPGTQSGIQSGIQSAIQSAIQLYPVNGPAQAGPGPGHGGMTPDSPRQVSPFLQPSEVPGSRDPGSLVTTTPPVPPSAQIASTSDFHEPTDGSGLSTRVKAIAESHRRIYF